MPTPLHQTQQSTPTIHTQGAVIRELEDELRVQQSPAYRAHAHKAILMTELLRLVQVCTLRRCWACRCRRCACLRDSGWMSHPIMPIFPESQEEMERIRGGGTGPVSKTQREEDERVLGFIEKVGCMHV